MGTKSDDNNCIRNVNIKNLLNQKISLFSNIYLVTLCLTYGFFDYKNVEVALHTLCFKTVAKVTHNK